MKRTEPLGVRVPLDIKEALDVATIREDRTRVVVVERALREWLVAHGYLK